MNFFTLPLVVNERREVIAQLGARFSVAEKKGFLIETNDGHSFPILSLKKDRAARSFLNGYKDAPVRDLRMDCSVAGKDVLVKVARKEKEKEKPAATPERPLSYEELEAFSRKTEAPREPEIREENKFVGAIGALKLFCRQSASGSWYLYGLIEEGAKEFCESAEANLQIRLQLDLQETLFQGKLNVSFCHPEQFLGIALDFGSESSQLAAKRTATGPQMLDRRPELDNFFQTILAFHKSQNWLDPQPHASYYQEEENTNYYKSIFFLKAELAGLDGDIDQAQFLKGSGRDLRMLVNTYDGYTTLSQQKFHQLPNLKITHQYNELFSNIHFHIHKDGYDVPISLGEIKDKAYNSILKIMVQSFLKKEFIRHETAKRKIRFVLLVPNIYDFQQVQQTQVLLHQMFKDFAESEFEGRILAWEIVTISESDASFLGYVGKTISTIQNDKDYVIIDSGKGTTDLSIIRTGKKNPFNIRPIFRDGFAGAGNLITYALFETVLHHIRATAASDQAAFRFIREQILAVLKSSDLERKNLFFQQLERLKFNFKKDAGRVKQQWANTRTGDISFQNLTEAGVDIGTLTALLQQMEHIGDFYGYVKETCEVIAAKIAGTIQLIQKNQADFQLGGVLLTGRSFLFEPLAEEVNNELKNRLAVSGERIERLQGNELKDICVKGVFHNAIQLNAEKVGFPIIVYPKKQEEAAKVQEPEKGRPGLQSRILKLIFNDLSQLEKSEAVFASEQEVSPAILLQSQILIGPNRYKIVANAAQDDGFAKETSADLAFTPNGYLARIKDGTGVVRNTYPLFEMNDQRDADIQLVIPSLFPNYLDDRHLDSLRRDDIEREPIMPPATPRRPPTSSDDSGQQGPMYF